MSYLICSLASIGIISSAFIASDKSTGLTGVGAPPIFRRIDWRSSSWTPAPLDGVAGFDEELAAKIIYLALQPRVDFDSSFFNWHTVCYKNFTFCIRLRWLFFLLFLCWLRRRSGRWFLFIITWWSRLISWSLW